jgi:hypothetical protein
MINFKNEHFYVSMAHHGHPRKTTDLRACAANDKKKKRLHAELVT